MRFSQRRTLSAAIITVVSSVLAVPAGAAEPVAVFDAVAMNTSNVGKRGLTRLQITIERWSSDAERDKLHAALVEKGTEGLLSALQDIKPRAGTISTTGSLGWNIQFAQQVELPTGSRRVIFATDRPMSFREEWTRDRSTDYQFMLAELRVGPNGKGEGKLVPRASITWNDATRTIEIENYANEPVRLSEVTMRKPKP
jgi:hypothetical protein